MVGIVAFYYNTQYGGEGDGERERERGGKGGRGECNHRRNLFVGNHISFFFAELEGMQLL